MDVTEEGRGNCRRLLKHSIQILLKHKHNFNLNFERKMVRKKGKMCPKFDLLPTLRFTGALISG